MEILDALLVLKEQAVKGCVTDNRIGICGNLDIMINGSNSDSFCTYVFVSDNCSDWQNFSGSISYPISPVTDCGLWEGEQLKLRLSLIDHLVAKAQELGV